MTYLIVVIQFLALVLIFYSINDCRLKKTDVLHVLTLIGIVIIKLLIIMVRLIVFALIFPSREKNINQIRF